MNISAKAVRFDDDTIWVALSDGRTISAPLAWFPRLLQATPEQRAAVRINASGQGLHWEVLDEDISVQGLLEGRCAEGGSAEGLKAFLANAPEVEPEERDRLR